MVLDQEIMSKSATSWSKKYALLKNEIMQEDIAFILNKYDVASEDAGRLTAAFSVSVAKDTVKRLRGGR